MAGIFYLTYDVTSIRIFSEAPREVHFDLAKKVFGYLKKYPKRGYAINPQPLDIDMEYKKVDLKMGFVNQ